MTDGKYIISGTWDRVVKIWSVGERKEVATLYGHNRVKDATPADMIKSLAVTSDGKYILSGNGDRSIQILPFQYRQEVTILAKYNDRVFSASYLPSEDWVNSVSVTADRLYIVTASGSKTVRIWSFHDNKEVASLSGYHRLLLLSSSHK